MTYTVACAECNLRREVGELSAVLDLQGVHRAKYGERHGIEFELVQ